MIKIEEEEKETKLEYYLNRARALRMLSYKTGKKKYACYAQHLAKEGRIEFEKEKKNENLPS